MCKFSFQNFYVVLSTRPAESVGSDDIGLGRIKATKTLEGALVRKGLSFSVDEWLKNQNTCLSFSIQTKSSQPTDFCF